MIVLVIILVVAAVGGVAAYVIMQYSGAGSISSGPSAGARTWTYDRPGGRVAERIADAPSGCLVSVLVALGVWIVAWLVFLIVGFRVLTS